jgi:hypothetical protein
MNYTESDFSSEELTQALIERRNELLQDIYALKNRELRSLKYKKNFLIRNMQLKIRQFPKATFFLIKLNKFPLFRSYLRKHVIRVK